MYRKQVLDFSHNNPFHRADGQTDSLDTFTASPEAKAEAYALGRLIAGGQLSRRPGIHVGDFFISAELLLLAATFVAILVGLRRR